MFARRGLMFRCRTPISLALQGGGAHGAFGWGVLDALIEDGGLNVRAVSAASAGAMNAVVATSGAMEGGPDGARAKLEAFWRAVARAGALFNPSRPGMWEQFMKGFGVESAGPGLAFIDAMARIASPYDLNPLNFHPMRKILDEMVDFERLRARAPVRLYISATNVRTGRVRIFDNRELTADVVLASACLPAVFHAVEIDGEAYWDGGYTGNPALFPLFYKRAARDLVIVYLNPVERAELPTSADAILNRLNEISFNAPVLAELRGVALARAFMARPRFGSEVTPRNVRMHAIRADAGLDGLPPGSKFNTEWSFLQELCERGRNTARAWIEASRRDLGRKSTLDIEAELDGRPAGEHA